MKEEQGKEEEEKEERSKGSRKKGVGKGRKGGGREVLVMVREFQTHLRIAEECLTGPLCCSASDASKPSLCVQICSLVQEEDWKEIKALTFIVWIMSRGPMTAGSNFTWALLVVKATRASFTPAVECSALSIW